jgi:hypothetical protein
MAVLHLLNVKKKVEQKEVEIRGILYNYGIQNTGMQDRFMDELFKCLGVIR